MPSGRCLTAVLGRDGKPERAKLSGKWRGVGRGHSTCEAPEQGWDDQRRRAWREGPRSEGRRVIAPDAGLSAGFDLRHAELACGTGDGSHPASRSR